ncbi:glycosyltransferase AglD [Natronomonas pharaonis DSM 2160]|uniref:Glycosyltransferase AglD n=1 Tax=Natronomonas pharaonis (strain ATCC 35678 / DSM 2160 / CIP 103997 / JCM 8858 / NBRC 14720 / NCIMB 2260 / Gabara) TaxID=348780 RepID=A0A1U7EVX6_NATPD|nr:flippase-like domain-containing protein [Natronomonas pharaonis]CAI49213.1 glycosyltransferase AglD [Natronomonas pharaonis DSM 2160]
MTDREVSVVLPAYNEADTIERTVNVTLETLSSFLPADSFEVLVAEDGCDDRTPDIASRMADADDRVRHFHSDERLGRGGALERAFEASDGEVLVYFDTDLATDMRHLEALVESVRTEGYDIATGSRRMPGKRQRREPERGIASTGYNALVRLFLRSPLYDHQCGFKAFDRDALLALADDIEDNHWFWDTELLVRAQRAGYDIKEFPVDWEPKGDTKVDLARDVFGMGSQILRLWWQLSVRPRIDRRTTTVLGTLLVVLAVFWLSQYLDPTAVLDAIRDADPALLAAATGLYVLSWPVRGVRYRDILSALGYRERVGFLTGAIFISQTGNLIFPARAGDAVRAYIVKARRDIPYPSGFASLAIERVFDLLTITALAGVTLLGLAAAGVDVAALRTADAGGGTAESGRTAVFAAGAVGAAALVAVAGIIATARTERNFVRGVLGRLGGDSYVDRVVAIIERFAADVQTVAERPWTFLVVAAASVLVWAIDIVTAIIVFAAFGIELPLWLLVSVGFFAVSVGNLAKVLPLSPGGIGLYEGAFTLIVVALTPVAWPVALAAAIVDHAIKNAVTVIGGVGSAVFFNVSLTTAVEESYDVDADAPVQE